MPRYEPTPAEQESLLPQAGPPASAPAPARYQQLGVESNPTPYSRNPRRSPFVCAGCTNALFPIVHDLFNHLIPSRKAITGYFSGFLFALGWWIFIDGCVYNSVKYVPGSNMNTLAFEDWVPGVLSTIALIV